MLLPRLRGSGFKLGCGPGRKVRSTVWCWPLFCFRLSPALGKAPPGLRRGHSLGCSVSWRRPRAHALHASRDASKEDALRRWTLSVQHQDQERMAYLTTSRLRLGLEAAKRLLGPWALWAGKDRRPLQLCSTTKAQQRRRSSKSNLENFLLWQISMCVALPAWPWKLPKRRRRKRRRRCS